MKTFEKLKNYRKEIILAPSFKLLEAFFDLLVPLVTASIIDTGIKNADQSYLIKMCCILVALGLIGLVCSITAQYFAARCAVHFTTGLKHDLFAHIQHFSYQQLDNYGTSSLINKLTADCNQIQSGLNLALRLLLRSPLIVFGSLVMAIRINKTLSLIFLGSITILLIVVFVIMLVCLPLYKKVQGKLDIVTGKLQENLSGVRVIRGYNDDVNQIHDFSQDNKQYTSLQLYVSRISSLLNPLTYVLINLSIILLLKQGAGQVNNGLVLQGEMTALYNYFGQMLVELIKLANLTINITKALASANRVNDVLMTQPELTDGEITKVEPQDTIIEFKNVSLRYLSNSNNSLSDVNIQIVKHERIGIIGPTGSGKTTFINLIGRYYQATSGEVLLNGVNVNDYNLQYLRSQVAMVPQKAVLFKGTVESNLKVGNPDATKEEMILALTQAQYPEIANEEGLTRTVEAYGNNFSGGQRQRMTLARAFIKKSPVLILDDSSSALDFATQSRVKKLLKGLDTTLIIVYPRINSIMDCDRIIVFDNDKIVACDTHEHLLKSCSLYKDIYNTQFKEAENEK